MAQNLQQVKFLSTPSARRATSQASNKSHRPKPFLSTPSARRATSCAASASGATAISIHALREEGDFYFDVICKGFFAFLSTPSARRATENDTGPWAQTQISIHALREEGDYQRAVAFA